jgi:DNA-binding transcriptional regulator YiaG
MGKMETALRDEITRLARKELRGMYGTSASDVRELKRTVSQLSRTVEKLEKLAEKQVAQEREEKAELQAPEDEVSSARFSPRLIRKLRQRLGLTQGQFAALVDVTPACIGFWEQGKTKPAGKNREALVAARKLGKREARGVLAHKGVEVSTSRRGKKG